MVGLMNVGSRASENEYHDLQHRYFQLCMRKAGMEQTLAKHELEESDQYEHIINNLETVKAQLDEITDEFEAEDFHAIFQQFEHEEST